MVTGIFMFINKTYGYKYEGLRRSCSWLMYLIRDNFFGIKKTTATAAATAALTDTGSPGHLPVLAWPIRPWTYWLSTRRSFKIYQTDFISGVAIFIGTRSLIQR